MRSGVRSPSAPRSDYGDLDGEARDEKQPAGTKAGTFSQASQPLSAASEPALDSDVAEHLDASRELGAATAQVERERPGFDFVAAFMAGYEAERQRSEGRCEDCGAALAHVQSASFAAVLCPECDVGYGDADPYATVSD